MPKKASKKSSNTGSKKVKNTKTVTQNDPAFDKDISSKFQENTRVAKAQDVEPAPSPKLIPTVEAEHVVESKKYSKRKVQSNWEKYEIPDDSNQSLESASTTRGYDFELIRNSGGGVGSHFQFKDEKDWADELGGSDSDSMNQFQSLDLNSLALSLSCIPYHQRLSIDPKYFTMEQIHRFEGAAQHQRVKYQKSLVKENDGKTKGTVQPAAQLLPSPVETPTTFPVEQSNIDEIPSVKTDITRPDISKNALVNETLIDEELEDELEALLALNKGKVENMCSIDISKLSLAPEIPSTAPSVIKSIPEIAAISKGSLEDWLDSALED